MAQKIFKKKKRNTSPFDQVLPNEKDLEQPPLDAPFNFDKINA